MPILSIIHGTFTKADRGPKRSLKFPTVAIIQTIENVLLSTYLQNLRCNPK